MKHSVISYILIPFITLIFTSCMDVVDVELEQGEPLLAVEGWITDQPGPYEVLLSRTSGYFNASAPAGVSNATVVITDNEGNADTLTERTPGRYFTQSLQGKIGNVYTLQITAEGEKYTAVTAIKRVAPIDSLDYFYREAWMGAKAGYYVRYYGPELPGPGDFFRIKLYRNDQLLNKPSNLIMEQDMIVDGNYLSALVLNNEPFNINDTIKVETLSLTEDAYHFFRELRTQVMNGGMFATPPANVRTNVVNQNATSSRKAVGYFGGSAVSTASIIIRGQE